ncbi:MAG: hypothetical protein IPM37_14370 [Hahellaceae bacterium]|nr:hypothetical protein [Hahellaceae bacterium]
MAHLLGDPFIPEQALEAQSADIQQLTEANQATRKSVKHRLPQAQSLQAYESETVACEQGGDIVLTSSSSSPANGLFSFTYHNCQIDGIVIQGSGHFLMDLNNGEIKTQYYNSVSYTLPSDPNQGVKISGYVVTTPNIFPLEDTYFVTLTKLSTQEQVRMEGFKQISYSADGNIFELSGHYYIDQFGFVDVSTQANVFKDVNGRYIEGQIEIAGQTSSAQISVKTSGQVRVTLDLNGDGISDKGVIIEGEIEWSNENFLQLPFVTTEQLNSPPVITNPYIYADGPGDSSTTLYAYYHTAIDEDEDTVVIQEYRWYVNQELQYTSTTSNALPAHTAKAGDLVEVEFLVSDGHYQVTTEKVHYTVRYGVGHVRVRGAPLSVAPGNEVQFTAKVQEGDQNGDVIGAAYLISGPDGAEIDDEGNVTWTASTSLISNSAQYTFVLSSSPDLNDYQTDIKRVNVLVNDSTGTGPIASSGLFVPRRNHSMHVGNFDGETGNELLVTDSVARIALFEASTDGYRQKWMYPYSQINNELVVQVLGYDLDEDGAQDIAVATRKHIVVINPVNNQYTPIYALDDQIIRSFALGKLAGDDSTKLALVVSHDSDFGSDFDKRLLIIDLASKETLLETQLSTSSNGIYEKTELAIGNVDHDPALEIITSDGFVFDGLSLQNQWYLGDKFGDSISVGDTDGDGLDEILGAMEWGFVRLYNALEKTSLTVLDDANTCSTLIANTEEDNRSEIIIGDCQLGSIRAYDYSGNTLSEQWQTYLQGSGSISLVTGDVDNDGVKELLWGADTNSTGPDQLIMMDLDDARQIYSGEEPSELDGFAAAGWGIFDNAGERAVFYIDRTNNGYTGSRFAIVNSLGRYTLSEQVNDVYHSEGSAQVVDYDHNGVSEILFTERNYSGRSISLKMLPELSDIWTSSTMSDDLSTAPAVDLDLNGDGNLDVAFVSGKTIDVIDIVNQVRLSSEVTSEGDIRDFKFVDADGDDDMDIVLASNTDLTLWTWNGVSFELAATQSVPCKKIAIKERTGNTSALIACLKFDGYFWDEPDELAEYQINEGSFVETGITLLDYPANDIASITLGDGDNEWLIVNQFPASNDYSGSYVTSSQLQIRAPGSHELLWASPSLLGTYTNNGLKVRNAEDTPEGGSRILVGTSSSMYQFF